MGNRTEARKPAERFMQRNQNTCKEIGLRAVEPRWQPLLPSLAEGPVGKWFCLPRCPPAVRTQK